MTTASQFLAREIAIEQERRNNAEDRRDLHTEMKNAGMSKVEIAGIKLAAKRSFEDGAKRDFRESVEEAAEALGQLSDTPLGRAAVESRAHA